MKRSRANQILFRKEMEVCYKCYRLQLTRENITHILSFDNYFAQYENSPWCGRCNYKLERELARQ